MASVHQECSADIFIEAENALNIALPISLKNVLRFNGFTDPKVIANINGDDFLQMEKFMAETAPDLIPTEEYEQYYGIFHRKPQSFTFIQGHKKLLEIISSYFQKKLQKENGGCEVEPRHSDISKSRGNSSFLPTAPAADKGAVNLTQEKSQISQTLKKWLLSKCTSDQQSQYFNNKFQEITFETKLCSNSQLCCTIKCFCKSSYKILKTAVKQNYSTRWVFGNIHKHLNGHLNEQSSEELSETESEIKKKPMLLKNNPSTTTKTAVLKRPQQGLMKFITVTKNENPKLLSAKCSAENRKLDAIVSINDCLDKNNSECNMNTDHDVRSNIVTANLPESGTVRGNSQEDMTKKVKTVANPAKKNLQILGNQTIVHAQIHSDGNREESNTSEFSKEAISEAAGEANYICKSQKWTADKYQRHERRRRKRESEVDNQPLITSFFSLVNEVDSVTKKIVNEDKEIGKKLETVLYNLPNKDTYGDINKSRSQLLKMLIDISTRNSKCSTYRNTYDETIKKFALYLFYVGGKLLYETVYENMKSVLPSISSLNNYVANHNTKIDEGFFDYDGLVKFLEERNLPKVVWISEDGTRVTGKIQYDSKTNKLVGFTLPLIDGLPKTDAFLATSAKTILEHFANGIKSNYAYLIMAQPLSKTAPGYCLSVYGTDNRFNANDVLQRWKNIKMHASSRGITILGFSSDGDTRLLKAMRESCLLPPTTTHRKTYPWVWYQAGYTKNDSSSISYIQDVIHILTKMRTRFLNCKSKSRIQLAMGKFVASPDHLQQLIANVSKDKHFLTSTDLKLEDKMNYEAARKICSMEVIQLLEQSPDTEGTCSYLKLMNLAAASFLDATLDIKRRVYNIWYCVFFLRIWRKWIRDCPSHTLGNNFLTTNCYTCFELNAHALINLIINYRDNPLLNNDMFLPWLFSSQTCEKTFRTTRSMTSCFSTVVNYSIKEIIQRLDRIKTINNILNDLKDILVFPRERQKDSTKNLVQFLTSDLKNLDDDCIENIVNDALKDAILSTQNLGMVVEENSWNYVSIPPISDNLEGTENEVDDTDLMENVAIVNHSEDVMNLLQIESESEEPDTDLCKDMSDISSLGVAEDLSIKDFSSTFPQSDDVNEMGQFTKVTMGSKSAVIKKSSLCWLLEESKTKISTDGLRRFITASKSSNSNQTKAKCDTKILGKDKNWEKPKRRMTFNETRYLKKRKRNDEDESSSESSDQECINYDDSTDTESFSDSPRDSPNDFDSIETPNEQTNDKPLLVKRNKFYAVYYEQKWYLGRIDAILKDEKMFTLTFLTQCRANKKMFKWPKKADIATVEKVSIFFGPLNFNSDEPILLDDSQYEKICEAYKIMKSRMSS